MQGATRFGVLLPTRQGVGFDAAPLRECLALARRAEALGFDSVWAGESILARPRHEPCTVLAAVAAACDRIGIGTAVALPALHPPVLLAHRLATLDQLSGGRLVVGAGLGVDNAATRAEFAAAGVPFEQRVGRLVETVRACRTLFRRDPSAAAPDAPGRRTPYWDLSGVTLETAPARPDGPPFWVGATVAKPAALARAGRCFDGWLPTAPSADAFASGLAAVRAAARDAGRPEGAVTGAVYLTVSVAADPRCAEAMLRTYVERYYGLPFEVMSRVQGMFAGAPEDAADWLRGYVRGGAAHVVLRSPDLGAQLDTLGALAASLREEEMR
jgi:alkanesulfonate monooxygenase SsuD/methylene tetrahydromethanopterin reductase-like flavin-dependent oxidoreductase (luciferase family)